MNNLVLLLTLLFGAQEASALMLDSVFMPLAIEKVGEPIQSARHVADDETLTHLNESAINGDGTADLLVQRLWPETLQKPVRITA